MFECVDWRVERNHPAVIFEIAKDTGCSSCTVEIREGSGTDEKHLLTSLTCGATTEFKLQSGYGLLPLYPNVTAAAGPCTDLDVAAHFSGGGN